MRKGPGNTKMSRAALEAKRLEDEERSDNFGILVDQKYKATEAELHSILKGAPKAVKDVLASDYTVAMRPEDYEEAAWFAAYSGDLGELLTVKDGGYSVDACLDRRASTPFYIACATGHLEVAEYMASTPGLVELNSQNHTGATPFFAACTGGHAKVVKYLAGKRRGDDFAVDIELPDDNGVTPYGIAVAMGHKDVVHEIDFARQVRIEVRTPVVSRSSTPLRI